MSDKIDHIEIKGTASATDYEVRHNGSSVRQDSSSHKYEIDSAGHITIQNTSGSSIEYRYQENPSASETAWSSWTSIGDGGEIRKDAPSGTAEGDPDGNIEVRGSSTGAAIITLTLTKRDGSSGGRNG